MKGSLRGGGCYAPILICILRTARSLETRSSNPCQSRASLRAFGPLWYGGVGPRCGGFRDSGAYKKTEPNHHPMISGLRFGSGFGVRTRAE